MADKYPSPSSMGNDKMYPLNKIKPMTEDEYQSRRSWLIDTAETPEDKKNLPKDLATLDARYKAQQQMQQQKSGTQANHAVTKVDRKTGKATK